MANSSRSESPGSVAGAAPGPAYRPIRRINQACIACRRKKSRCTGGHPCRSCRRLSEPCQYPAPGAPRARTSSRLPNDPSSQISETSERPLAVADRLSVLESALDGIAQQLGHLTELTRQICASGGGGFSVAGGPIMTAGAMSERSLDHSSPGSEVTRTIAARQAEYGSYNDPFHPQHWTVKMKHLIPDNVMRAVFRNYFQYAHNQPYSFFHESKFWEKLDGGSWPDHLLLAVLAHAVRFSEDQFFRGRTKQMAQLFANMAWKAIVNLYFHERGDADLATVQTITLLSIYDFTAGHDRHDSAWVKIGLAVRVAQDLRLMMNDQTTLDNAEKEERRRVFWSVYILDRLASCARARPPAVLEASCHLSLPCEEHLWRAGFPSNGYKLEDVAQNRLLVGQHPGHPALVVAMTSILGRCTQCMMQNVSVRPRQAPWDGSSDYATISSELLTCEGYFEQPIEEALALYCTGSESDIDAALAGPLVFSHVLFMLSHCILSQPFLLCERVRSSLGKPPSTFLSRALDNGYEYAKRITHLIRDAKLAGNAAHGSFYGYCTLMASTIHAIGLFSARETVREESAACLSICREILDDLSPYWESCQSMVGSHLINSKTRS
ncbi:zn 2cys6 transcription factor [Verticillium dahliae]